MPTLITDENRAAIQKEFFISHRLITLEVADETYSVWDRDHDSTTRHYLVQKSVGAEWAPVFTFYGDEGKAPDSKAALKRLHELAGLVIRNFNRPRPKRLAELSLSKADWQILNLAADSKKTLDLMEETGINSGDYYTKTREIYRDSVKKLSDITGVRSYLNIHAIVKEAIAL